MAKIYVCLRCTAIGESPYDCECDVVGRREELDLAGDVAFLGDVVRCRRCGEESLRVS